MRRFSLFVSLFVVTLFATLTLTACGGGASAANPATLTAGATTPSSSTPPPPSSTPPPTTPPPTTPPPPSTVIDNVEDAPWLTCGACGNDHATGAVAPSSVVTNVTSPSEDGSSTQFAIAPTIPYTNVYWYQEHQAPSGQLNSITYEFDLYIPSGSENASQGIEF